MSCSFQLEASDGGRTAQATRSRIGQHRARSQKVQQRLDPVTTTTRLSASEERLRTHGVAGDQLLSAPSKIRTNRHKTMAEMINDLCD